MSSVIDPHCHLGLDFPYEEDMWTETAAAANAQISKMKRLEQQRDLAVSTDEQDAGHGGSFRRPRAYGSAAATSAPTLDG